ncbi:MAG: hypothetical protein WAM60_24345 [Candidatus Promineifilaceae bacterium]
MKRLSLLFTVSLGFGIFRILGYSTDDWLLLQLVRVEDNCIEQTPTAITTADIAQPAASHPISEIIFVLLLAAASVGTLSLLRRRSTSKIRKG